MIHNNHFMWWWEQAAAKPTDWGAMSRAAYSGLTAAIEQLQKDIERAKTDPRRSETANLMACLAGLTAFGLHLRREQAAKEGQGQKRAEDPATPGAQKSATEERRRDPEPPVDPIREAASLLGVSVDASPDEIRAALRSKMTELRIHPDHGGDEETAKRYTGAKTLLVERANRLRTSNAHPSKERAGKVRAGKVRAGKVRVSKVRATKVARSYNVRS